MRHRFSASEFEFRHRVFFIFFIFAAGFACSWFDHTLAGAALARMIFGSDASFTLPGRQWPIRTVYAFGTLIIILGAIIRTWAAGYLQSSVVHDRALHSDELLADGPYRYVRNPLYLGTLLWSIGLGLLFTRAGWAVIVLLTLIFEYRLIFREEIQLLSSQGDSYGRYLAKVNRLFPSLRPQLPKGHRQPHWVQATVGEIAPWLFAFAMLAFTITLRPQLTIAIIIAACAAQLQLLLRWFVPARNGRGEKAQSAI